MWEDIYDDAVQYSQLKLYRPLTKSRVVVPLPKPLSIEKVAVFMHRFYRGWRVEEAVEVGDS